MSTEEAAASLFGAEDSASDPFASIGSDTPDTFQDVDTASYASWPEPSPPAAGNGPASYAPAAPSSSGASAYTPSQQYQPQAYVSHQPPVQNIPPAAALDPYIAAKSYDPYTPPATHSAPTQAPAQPAYSSYAPPAQTHTAPPPLPASPYSAYTPATPSPAVAQPSPYSTPAVNNTPYASLQQKVAVVPPPPAPAPSLNRPKLSNAYDPPFPTSRPARRGVSASARSSAFSAYASPPQPPPPLPAVGQFTSSGYSLPPLPPPPERSSSVPNASAWATPPPPNAPQYPSAGTVGAPPSGPPPPRPLSSSYTPRGMSPQVSPEAPYESRAHDELVDFEGGFAQPPSASSVDAPLRSSSSATSSGPPRSASRADSVSSSHKSGRSADVSFPPPAGDVNRTSSPALFSSPDPVSADPYAAPQRTASPSSIPDRPESPASVPSLDRTRSPPVSNPYLPNPAVQAVQRERASSPLKKSTVNPYDPPKPALGVNGYATGGSGSAPLTNGLQGSASQYLPPKHAPPPLPRNRSTSSGSMYSSSPERPYAPPLHGVQQRSETDYGNYTSRYNYGAAGETSPYELAPAQEILMKPVQPGAYAPSPSLLGANDPLMRTSSRAPVFSFGFGGKLLTCFHGASMNTGFDVALSSRNSTGIHIRQLNKIIPQSALEVSSATFPGPLFSDPGTPTTGLVRTTTSSAQTKAKKARLTKYLTDRAEEISKAIGYLHAGTVEGRQAEGKLVLVNLLRILVENDGRLSGTPQIDTAVRKALLPKLEATDSSPDDASMQSGFSSIADFQRPLGDSSGIVYPAVSAADSNDAPIATSTLRPSALEKIQNFLIRGERRKAYHYALDEKLWAHAMVIASSIDRDAWKEAVNEFLKTELGSSSQPRGLGLVSGTDAQPTFNGRESLRVAYSLYSGQGSASVQELVPQNLLSRAAGRLQVPTASHMTPMTPNFAAPAVANNIPADSLAAWADTAAMMLSSPMTADTSSALTALGDQLLAHQWVEAAHACYLLAPQTSPLGGIGNPTARIVLLGSRSPQVWPSFFKDSDPVIFTEILEFALSLNTPAKGQDAFVGLPHLQAYRFIRATTLAELGELQVAGRYCEAITASFGTRGSPYFTGALLDQLKALSDRIVGLDHSDKSSFWKSTASFNTIGRFFEGQFIQLVTGDMDPGTPIEEHSKIADSHSGPFSQYSTISSTTTSTSPSPQPSLYNLNAQASQPPPFLSGSAMGQSGLKPQPPIDRASSAMDHVRRRASPPPPRISSANASTTTFAQAQAPSFVQAYSNYSPNPYSPSMATPRANAETSHDEEDTGQEVSWWGSSSYNNDSANQTPMAATFHQVDSGVSSSSDGFISLMDENSYSVAPAQGSEKKQSQPSADEDEEDLGFGNSKRPPKKEEGAKEGAPAAAAPASSAPAPPRPDAKPAPASASGSWFGRWWKRSDAATPGPVKANLGEETSFVYDKELKRWVNKKAGAEEAKPAAPPPPPPSRPQTASPGMTGPRQGGATPPPRSASVADMGGPPPPGKSMRVRSNLAPTPEPTPSLPNSPLRQSSLNAPSPPPGRPKSQASKRNVRHRYVDVFQQEGGAA